MHFQILAQMEIHIMTMKNVSLFFSMKKYNHIFKMEKMFLSVMLCVLLELKLDVFDGK